MRSQAVCSFAIERSPIYGQPPYACNNEDDVDDDDEKDGCRRYAKDHDQRACPRTSYFITTDKLNYSREFHAGTNEPAASPNEML
jgi:hypothetical protein